MECVLLFFFLLLDNEVNSLTNMLKAFNPFGDSPVCSTYGSRGLSGESNCGEKYPHYPVFEADSVCRLSGRTRMTPRAGKKIEIHLPSGSVNFSFHLPLLKYYLPTCRPVWKSEDKREQSMLGFLANPWFQPNG